ncbi:MAG TPA: Holliday junction branch migration protein RuvA [Tepidisphaeraceae bacterium]|jgi:Holliday junction DNA helicase RuvA|nr:Holliday junction branch migration protein RuvA [Tepidisphaeraceae bacterium]
MISAITGTLKRVDDDRIQLECGPMLYELLIPASDLTELQASLGETLTLQTIFYLSGDPSRGGLEPTLIAFVRPADKQFFELFTTVKGIGPRKALKALTAPTGEIAAAIESKDTRFLSGLGGIGKRTAETIVAELSGKAAKFAFAIPAKAGGKGATQSFARRPDAEEDAISALMALGERRGDAEHFLERAKANNPDLKSTDVLLREMLRLRTVRG